MPVRCLFLTVVLVVGLGCPSRPSGLDLPELELPIAQVGEAYRAELRANGGTAPLTHSVAGLPPGFSFYTDTGVLEGTPRVAGSWRMLVSVTDASGRMDARTYRLDVAPNDGDAASARLTIANWNVQWFGSTEGGPTNEPLQADNAATVITTVAADIWALNEIMTTTAFEQLIADASARTSVTYEGILSNGSSVVGGSASYHPTEHKVGLVWKEGVLSDVSAEIILSTHDHAFGGRPPLKVEAIANIDGARLPLTLVVLHMKAFDDETSYQRRKDAGAALKRWLDTLPEAQDVIVLGDWNDDLDASIAIPNDTPFRPLVESSRYTFLTEVFSWNDISTTTSYPTPIDHQLVSASLAARHVEGSTAVVRPVIDRYARTTSDHYPVRSTFVLGPRGAGVEDVTREASLTGVGEGRVPVTHTNGVREASELADR